MVASDDSAGGSIGADHYISDYEPPEESNLTEYDPFEQDEVSHPLHCNFEPAGYLQVPIPAYFDSDNPLTGEINVQTPADPTSGPTVPGSSPPACHGDESHLMWTYKVNHEVHLYDIIFNNPAVPSQQVIGRTCPDSGVLSLGELEIWPDWARCSVFGERLRPFRQFAFTAASDPHPGNERDEEQILRGSNLNMRSIYNFVHVCGSFYPDEVGHVNHPKSPKD
jgi:hypothetical protein